MRILVFNGYYFPSKNYGGPQTSIQNLIEACGDLHDFFVVCKNHDYNSRRSFDAPVRQVVKVGKANVIYIEDGDLDYSLDSMTSFLKAYKPNIIWFSGVLVPAQKMVGCMAARKLHIPVLFSPRGELNEDHVRIKAWKKKPMLWLLRHSGLFKDAFFHATGSDEYNGVVNYLRPRTDHVFNVPNVALTKQPICCDHVKKEGYLRCFFLSRIHPVKNISYAIDVLSQCKTHIVYDIYGPIEDDHYWTYCLNKLSKIGPNVHVEYKGFLAHENMESTIQTYDCLFFMSENENYSHTIAETLANSRPVVIGKHATPWDDIDGKAGFVVPLDNPQVAASKLDYLAMMEDDSYKKLISSVNNYYLTAPLITSAVSGHLRMFESIFNSV